MGTSDTNSPFPPTRWTAIANIRQMDDSRLAQQALAGLCRDYWYPLYAFARRAGRSVHDAQDLTQGFFCQILENNLFAEAEQEKGKLRTFLLTAFCRHMGDVATRDRAQKRGGGQEMLRLDLAEGEERYVCEPSDNVTPEMLYERSWATTVCKGALADLTGAEERAGRGAQCRTLEGFLSPENAGGSDYAAASAALKISEDAARQAVSRLRRKFRDCLRRQIANTLNAPSERQIDEELAALGAALTKA